jgi:hypothetical protein
VWSDVEIELALARCTQLLKGLDVVTVAEEPFRQGECGAPAPVRLVSVGKSPTVAVSPPALLTCDMVASLHKLVVGDLQPLAKKQLGTEIAKIDVMSDYSCRRAYGRVGNKLSEHAHANALDIRGFVTKTEKTAFVLDEWGETRRDIAAKLAAAAKAEKERLEAEAKAAKDAAKEKAAHPEKGTEKAIARPTLIEGLPKGTVVTQGAPPGVPVSQPTGATGLSFAPRHLGGPNPASAAARGEKPSAKQAIKDLEADKNGPSAKAPAMPPIPIMPSIPVTAGPEAPQSKMSLFLREAHAAGCRIFGTTLGPEANEAHRNHFHVDMAERKRTKICD